MFYVEQLRVRNGLIWVGVGLGAILLVTLALAAGCPLLVGPRGCEAIDISNTQAVLAIIGYAAAITAAIFASIFGSSLAIENDGHLEIAWTRPISRTRNALGKLLIDVAAIVTVFVLCYATGWLVVGLLGDHPFNLAYDGASLLKVARFLAFPLAWFGLTQALTAGIKGGWFGAIVGPLWPVCQGLFAVGLLPLSAPWHRIWQIANIPNPIAYFPFWVFDENVFHVYQFGYGVVIDAIALVAIAIIGITLATLRWQRLEA
jgi:hypothetical protein